MEVPVGPLAQPPPICICAHLPAGLNILLCSQDKDGRHFTAKVAGGSDVVGLMSVRIPLSIYKIIIIRRLHTQAGSRDLDT